MAYKILRAFKEEVSEENFKVALEMTTDDIKFNRINFGKVTGPEEFLNIFTRCLSAISRVS
ncbi:MAG: hypothetical protein ACRCVJ_00780 [Clostridium sp.]|uniref:hypothetical protein n=1 Tax=Clostridium sp. TaxID=1506 RepID=UPI003F41438F